MKIRAVVWDDDNVEHIGRHSVEPWEVEQALRVAPKFRRAREHRYLAAGRTEAGRHLIVFFRYLGGGIIRPVTARDMTRRERRTYETK